MKFIAALLILVATSAFAQRGMPTNLPSSPSFAEAVALTRLYWERHQCFKNEDVQAATELIRWQQARIAELERKLAARQ